MLYKKANQTDNIDAFNLQLLY